MKQYIYDLTTGLFTGAAFETSIVDPDALAAFFAAHTPPGCAVIAADTIDTLSQKVDIPSGLIVAYVPPSPTPAANYTWNTATLRWQLTPAQQALLDAAVSARSQIAALHAKALPLMLLWATGVAPAANMVALTAIRAQVVALQAQIPAGG